MFYRISLIVNTVICIALLLLALFALAIERDFSDISLMVVSVIFIMSGIFLWLNFNCRKLMKINREHSTIPQSFKTTGKFVFVLTILDIVAVLLLIILAISEMINAQSRGSDLKTAPLVITLTLFLLLIFSAVANLIFYRRLVKNNERSINEMISEIGA